MTSASQQCGQPRRTAGIGFKIIERPPADLDQLTWCIHVRLIARRSCRREGHRDLPLTGVSNEKLRLEIGQRHLSKIKTDLFSGFTPSRCFQHSGLGLVNLNMAADHSDLVRGVRDTRCAQHEQPPITATDQYADGDRVQLSVHQMIRTCAG
jgi:hypothetical protein